MKCRCPAAYLHSAEKKGWWLRKGGERMKLKGGEEGWQRSRQSIRTVLVLKNKTVQSVQENQCNQDGIDQWFRSYV
jgi:hypothetical protein